MVALAFIKHFKSFLNIGLTCVSALLGSKLVMPPIIMSLSLIIACASYDAKGTKLEWEEV